MLPGKGAKIGIEDINNQGSTTNGTVTVASNAHVVAQGKESSGRAINPDALTLPTSHPNLPDRDMTPRDGNPNQFKQGEKHGALPVTTMSGHKQRHANLMGVGAPLSRASKRSGNQHTGVAKDRETSGADHGDPAMTRNGEDSSPFKSFAGLVELLLSSTAMKRGIPVEYKFSAEQGQSVGDVVATRRPDFLPMLGEGSTSAEDTSLAAIDLDMHGIKERVRHLVFLHYNGFHYNRLCVPPNQECKFLRSFAKGDGSNPVGMLDNAGGGATKRKASTTPASAPHPMCDNPLVVDITPRGPTVAVVEVRYPRKRAPDSLDAVTAL
eukprot:351041-Amphidinium_carterae.2